MQKTSVLLLLFLNISIYAQTNFNSETLKVTRADLELNVYEKDSTANALVLHEYGNSYIDNNDYSLITEEKRKIKILNREGFNKANVTIYLQKSDDRKEKVKNIVATTYNLVDGKVTVTKLSDTHIFEEEYNDDFTLVKFTLPNIKEGSVINYSYTLQSPFKFNYQGWSFQSDIPKLYSEYNTSIPANYEYNIKLVGGKKLFKNDQKIKRNCLYGGNGAHADCTISSYAMKDIPAFIEEDYMTSKYNFLARIEYELKVFKGFDGRINNYTKTWKTTDREFRTDKDIGKQLSKSIDLEDFVSHTVITEKDTYKKADAIYKHVQENYTWNGDYKIFSDVSVKNLIKNKSGNVSSINILLHNLLKEADIDVKPVLISTRDHGFPTKIYPVISDFNYLIVQATIDDKTYLLDATDEYLSFGEIPLRCLNSYGRLMDFKKGSEWVDLKPSTLTTIQFRAELNMGENDNITGSVKSKKTGYHALDSRKSYHQNNDAYLTNLEDKYPNIEISNHEVTNEGKTNPDFLEAYDIEYNWDDTGDNIYLNPFFTSFFKENPFKLQERSYPIDFGYKRTYYYMLKINFDDSYTVLEQPENLRFTLPNNKGSVHFSNVIIDNAINIMLKISFEDAIYPAEYYPYLKAFMSKIVDIQTNSLILLKKK
ncbi:DUF3857 domain-containing protein [Hwangdonia lutea]|uniref:DUF3857 domain-containing protein n=1 Tax=Hwangdonia lutea TaxID=3075823 RepID=A0AA97EMB8_9FLAO|nr:DUF3857 domain-containing protein [Hwangdonia sp. SCSIO 19198]WOD44051.1 DUF3857 domain-containing protein [Hwangdonia sp. SCSIO 19198]